jgi:hypothetical protein
VTAELSLILEQRLLTLVQKYKVRQLQRRALSLLAFSAWIRRVSDSNWRLWSTGTNVRMPSINHLR